MAVTSASVAARLLLLAVILQFVGSHGAVQVALAAQPHSGGRAHHPSRDTALAHITFAGCNRQYGDQRFWDTVAARVIAAQPDHFLDSESSGDDDSAAPEKKTDALLWTGNAVYADAHKATPRRSRGAPTLDEIEAEYRMLAGNSHYANFVDRVVRNQSVIGVWDMHDVGMNDVAERFNKPPSVRDAYVRHILGNRKSIQSQLRGHDGLYYFSAIPAPAESLLALKYKNAVCTIAIDVLTHREDFPDFSNAIFTPLRRETRGAAQARPLKELDMTDMLGEQQWAWLESTIKRYTSPFAEAEDGTTDSRKECAVTLIVSAWQVLLNDNKPFAGWDLYPASRTRLLTLLRSYKAERVLFVSGHAEMAEIGAVVALSEKAILAKQTTGVMGMYARTFPMVPLTKYSRALLPPAKRDYAAASGLVELSSSGTTHRLTKLPFVQLLTELMLEATHATDPLEYNSMKVRSAIESPSSVEAGRFQFMSQYLQVVRRARIVRNFGTLQLLVPTALARRKPGQEATETDVHAVDDEVRVVVTLHSATDGSTLISYESRLSDLPSYEEEEDDRINDAEVKTGGKAVSDFRERPPFFIVNIPGEVPSLKRTFLQSNCAEAFCYPTTIVRIIKIIFMVIVACIFFFIMAAVLLAIKSIVDKFEERLHAEKLKKD